MSNEYWIRRTWVQGFIDALPIEPDKCDSCGWPVGGTGKYVCPCGNTSERNGDE